MKKIIGLTILFILFVACTKEEPQRPLVIVGDSQILPGDITGMVPSELWRHLSDDEKNEILTNLIEKELLAQEAVKRGISADPQVSAKIRAAQRDILANTIEENIISTGIKVKDKEIKDFYRKNPVLFVRSSDEVHLYKMTFPDEQSADSAMAMLTAKNDSMNLSVFREIAFELQLDTTEMDLDYIPIDGLFRSLEKRIEVASKGDLIGPLSGGRDYSIFYVFDLGREGTTRPLNYVQKEIENLIYLEKSEDRRQAFTDSLREFYQPELERGVWDSLLHR